MAVILYVWNALVIPVNDEWPDFITLGKTASVVTNTDDKKFFPLLSY
jgi:hypothetical protein